MTYQFPPRLLPSKAAAHYLGISESKLRTLNLPRKESGGNRLFDRADLDAYADGLPYEGEKAEGEGEENTCDALMGE